MTIGLTLYLYLKVRILLPFNLLALVSVQICPQTSFQVIRIFWGRKKFPLGRKEIFVVVCSTLKCKTRARNIACVQRDVNQ